MKIASLETQRSAFGPDETMKRFSAAIEARGMTVFARIDHAAAAAQTGLTLRPTAVIIFGDPRMGTPLMQVTRTVAIDLPLRALVWQDVSGATWLSYNDPSWFLQRHGLDPSADPALAMATALIACVQEAVVPGDAAGQ
jgi:uncharacterized protein (DUF302 family)